MNAVTSEIAPSGELAAVARHELRIPGPVAEVFEMTRDVTRWSEYMPAVTQAAFVEQDADGDVVEISAEANDQEHTWLSRRAVDRTQLTIEFSRVGAVAPLVTMTGRWEFFGDDSGSATRAVLTHRFATSTPEALEFYSNATRSNATRDLEGLAEFFAAKEGNR